MLLQVWCHQRHFLKQKSNLLKPHAASSSHRPSSSGSTGSGSCSTSCLPSAAAASNSWMAALPAVLKLSAGAGSLPDAARHALPDPLRRLERLWLPPLPPLTAAVLLG